MAFESTGAVVIRVRSVSAQTCNAKPGLLFCRVAALGRLQFTRSLPRWKSAPAWRPAPRSPRAPGARPGSGGAGRRARSIRSRRCGIRRREPVSRSSHCQRSHAQPPRKACPDPHGEEPGAGAPMGPAALTVGGRRALPLAAGRGEDECWRCRGILGAVERRGHGFPPHHRLHPVPAGAGLSAGLAADDRAAAACGCGGRGTVMFVVAARSPRLVVSVRHGLHHWAI